MTWHAIFAAIKLSSTWSTLIRRFVPTALLPMRGFAGNSFSRHSGMKPPVFIVGCPRSGTSFLYHLLLSAGGFAEFHTQMNVYDVLEPIYGDLGVRKNKESAMREWLQSKGFRASGLEAAENEAKVLAECHGAGDFLRIIMEEVARRQRVDRWIDSTPTNVPHMLRIQKDMPDALFVHIIRDARDVALSLDKRSWSRPLPWDKQKSLLAIGGFLGQDLDYERIQQASIGSVKKPLTSFKEELQEGRFTPVGRWKDRFPPEQLI